MGPRKLSWVFGFPLRKAIGMPEGLHALSVRNLRHLPQFRVQGFRV